MFHNNYNIQRKEPLTVPNTNLKLESKSGLYAITSIDSNLANNTFLASSSNAQETLNSTLAPHRKNNVEYDIGESNERFEAQDFLDGQISFCKKEVVFPKKHNFNQENLNVPIINFHLKQVIAPSNDVLKKMVPVIVFAIVQGLDEFRDTIPNFIDKFVKLKRFIFIDVVESVTIHMREHQIQQVRTQKLETIRRLISESVTLKSNFKTNNKSEKTLIDAIKFSNRDKNETYQINQSNESEYEHEKKNLDINKNTDDFQKIEGIKNSPLKLQIHEIRNKSYNSSVENKSSLFENKFLQEERTFEAKNITDEPQTSQISNQIIKHPTLSNICDVCQDCKIEENIGICWHRFPNSGVSISIPSNDYTKKNTFGCELQPLSQVEQFSGNWSYNDPSLKAWLKGKRSLAGPDNISQISQISVKQIESVTKDHRKQRNSTKTRSFEEIMACRLRDDLNKKILSTPININFGKSNEITFNQTYLNSRVTFSNDENLGIMRRNEGQILLQPTTSIMKKYENSKNTDRLISSLQNFENVSVDKMLYIHYKFINFIENVLS